MADVFISYARADQQHVAGLVELLSANGLTVWWDRNIVGGTEFHRVIEDEINTAKKVVVLWSRTSVSSVWVRDEAGLARDLGKLVPLAVDDCVVPLGFRSLHTLRSPSLDDIADDLLIACGRTPRSRPEPSPVTPSPTATAGAEPKGPPADPEKPADSADDIFQDLFGGFMGRRPDAAAGSATGGNQRGSDLRYDLKTTLEEAFSGKIATITLSAQEACASCAGTGSRSGAGTRTCPTCAGLGKVRASQGFFTIERNCPDCSGRGDIPVDPCAKCAGSGQVIRDRTLQVKIPPGVDTGTRIRLAGEGETGSGGGARGDLYVWLTVMPHPVFQRENNDLIVRLPLPLTTAALGGHAEIAMITGTRSRMRIPEGTQNGQQFRLKGKGMPVIQKPDFGDLYVEIEIETPQIATDRQRALLEDLRALDPDWNREPLCVPVEEQELDQSCQITVPIVEAALGGKVLIKAGDHPTMMLTLPAGSQNGTVLRLRGKAREGGDLYVRLRTRTPVNLTPRHRELLHQFAAESQQETNPESHGFLARMKEFFDGRPAT